MKNFIFAILLSLSFAVHAATFKKITELSTTAMTTTATNDLIVVVDTSSGPTTYSMSFDELDKRFFNTAYTSTATFNTDVVIEDTKTLTVDSTMFVKGLIMLKSPDETCAACGIDNADSFTCTSTGCLP